MIEVSKKYGLDSDGEHNFIILKKTVAKDGQVNWKPVGFHSNIVNALESIYNRESKSFIASSEGKTLKEVTEEWRKIQLQFLQNMKKSGL